MRLAKTLVHALAAATFVMGSPAAAAPAAPAAAPSWGLNVDSKQCSLWRSEGSGRESKRLGIRPSLAKDSARLFLVYRGSKSADRWVKGSLKFDATEVPINFLDFPATDPGTRFIKFDVPAQTADALFRSQSLTLKGEGVKELRFSLRDLPAHRPRLDQCVAGLVQRLGLDEAGRGRVAREAQFNVRQYFNEGDFPALAARLGISGGAKVNIAIGSDGKAIGCSVEESSGNAMLDYVTCETFEKEVVFTPALDADGRPVASIRTHKIIWRVK